MSFQNNGNSLNGRNRYSNSTIAYQLMRSQTIHNAPDAKILIEKRNLCASTDDISEHPQCTNGNNCNEKSTAAYQLMSAQIACNVPSARDRNEN
jgi:hypothetical protein